MSTPQWMRKILKSSISKAIHADTLGFKTKAEIIDSIFRQVLEDMEKSMSFSNETAIPNSQVNGDAPKQPIQLEDFIKMLQKKKDEYLKEVSQQQWSRDSLLTERQVTDAELKSFLRFLIGQTNQYARLQAEQTNLQKRIDKKNQEIEEYIKTRWE